MGGNKRFLEQLELLENGQEKMLLSDYIGAISLFEDGIQSNPPKKGRGHKDLRALFGIMHGLLLAVKSISSLGKSELKSSLRKLQEAEKLTHHQEDWAGRRIFKGIALACIGGIEMSQRNFVKGILTLSKSTKYLKAIQKSGLDYEGPERPIIRSGSLVCLGILQVTYSSLSDRKGKLAKWLSGFAGDRVKGMENLLVCFEEKGVFAAWSAIAFILIHTDSNNLMGDEDIQAHLSVCYEMLTWFREKYEPSGIVTACEIAVAQLERNLTKVEQLIVSRKPLFKLPGPKLLILSKGGMLNLCRLKFAEAGSCYKQAMDELMKVGQRGMVPYNSTFAFLCFLQVLKEIKDTELRTNEVYLQLQINTERSISRLLRVFDWCMKKKNYSWGGNDKAFYSFVTKYVEFDESLYENDIRQSVKTTLNRVKEGSWVFLDLSEKLVFDLQASSFMSEILLKEFLNKLEEEKEQQDKLSKEDLTRYLLVKSELYIQLHQHEQALSALDLIKPRAKPSIYEFASFYLRGRIAFVKRDFEESRRQVKRIKKLTNENFKFKEYLNHKVRHLLRAIDVEYCKIYDKVIVSKRSRVTFLIDLTSQDNREKLKDDRKFGWSLVGDCLSCRIEMYHKVNNKKRKKTLLHHVTKDTDLRTQIEGALDIPEEGTLFINFDNHTNLLNSKTLYFNMEPKLSFKVKQEKSES